MSLDAARAVTTGYMSDAELEWLATQAAGHQRILEVGSWTGRSTLALAHNTRGTVWAIDTWAGSTMNDLQDILVRNGPEWAFNEFRRNLADCSNVYLVRDTSLHASLRFDPATFDLIFIDGSHDYASVKNDLIAWAPKLIRGGLLCGHDYCPDRWPDVTRVVNELYPDARHMEPSTGERSLWWTNV